jgi:hypothetical protein
MQRIVDYKYSELIRTGFERIPKKIAERLNQIDFFTGTDPNYAGLFKYKITFDGRSYGETWCFVDELTTIVLPNLAPEYPFNLNPLLIVHELGHALDQILNYEFTFKPVTKYAKSNRGEAFADAFTLWTCPEYQYYYPLVNQLEDNAKFVFRQLEEGF